jgi:hypothetical protein
MIDRLIHRVKVKQAEIKEALATGNVNDFQAYQRLVGQYLGLQETLAIIDNLLDEDKNGD